MESTIVRFRRAIVNCRWPPALWTKNVWSNLTFGVALRQFRAHSTTSSQRPTWGIVPISSFTVLTGLRSDWKESMRQAIRDPHELCELLDLPPQWAIEAQAANADFGLFAPREYVARMKPGDPHDPLLLQVLPTSHETMEVAGFGSDPVGDQSATVTPNLLHKYEGRVLLMATGVCAIHCRYCFRRHFPYEQSPPHADAWDAAVERIAADDSIGEVILSGGDPLTLTDEQLARLVTKIAAVDHVQRLRIHTRLPIVIPARVTDGLLDLLRKTRLTPVVVVHANHAQELDVAASAALRLIADTGAMLFNQAVILRNINDTAAAQMALCERLLAARTTPYYLHEFDRVAGAAHFEAEAETGLEIIAHLRENLPGYAVPRLVRELPGEKSKTWIQ